MQLYYSKALSENSHLSLRISLMFPSTVGTVHCSNMMALHHKDAVLSTDILYVLLVSGSGGLFGTTPASSGGSLFGQPASSGTGLFGSAATASSGTGGLFGKPASSSTGGGGLFGASAATSGTTSGAGGGLFGSATTTAPSQGLFGSGSECSVVRTIMAHFQCN